MDSSRPTPIFQIGFNKCGTASIHYFLQRSGLQSLHWLRGVLARVMSGRIDANEDPIQDFPNAIGFTDMLAFGARKLIEPYKRFDYLHQWYPDALFILNTRDREKWIASRLSHVAGGIKMSTSYAHFLKIPEHNIPDFWRAEWETHHALAREYFAGMPNFLEFHIEKDDSSTLATFIASRYPQVLDTPFHAHNVTPPERRMR